MKLKRAFTVIETICVIAIFVIMVAILWPVINRGSNGTPTQSLGAESETRLSTQYQGQDPETNIRMITIKDKETGREYLVVKYSDGLAITPLLKGSP
jgi:prepilin-type N-terminal cleavage/methylation domain-containing protein